MSERAFRRREPIRVAKFSPVLAGRLSSRADCGRLFSGARSEEEHSMASRAASAWWATRARSSFLGGPFLELSACGAVDATRRECALLPSPSGGEPWRKDSTPSCVVSIRRRGSGREDLRRICERLEQTVVGAGRGDRQGVEERPCVGAKSRGTGENGVSNGLRHLVGERCQHLGDEERVPGGQPVELVGISGARIGEHADSATRERPHLDTANAGTVARLPSTTRRGGLPSSSSRYVATTAQRAVRSGRRRSE